MDLKQLAEKYNITETQLNNYIFDTVKLLQKEKQMRDLFKQARNKIVSENNIPIDAIIGLSDLITKLSTPSKKPKVARCRKCHVVLTSENKTKRRKTICKDCYERKLNESKNKD